MRTRISLAFLGVAVALLLVLIALTFAPGAPTPPPSPFTTAISKTAWYSYTASANATITANTIGSAFDTVLAVYTGDGFTGGGPGGDQAPFVRIPCANLGLTTGGGDLPGGGGGVGA